MNDSALKRAQDSGLFREVREVIEMFRRLQMAKNTAVPPPVDPWIKTTDKWPPCGIVILWYVQGHVRAGVRLVEPDGLGMANFAFGNVKDVRLGRHRTAEEDFTHWRPLPDKPTNA